GVVADEVEEILARCLDKLWAQKHIVVDIVHPNDQRPHWDRGAVALEFSPGRFCDAGREDAVHHGARQKGSIKRSTARKPGRDSAGQGGERVSSGCWKLGPWNHPVSGSGAHLCPGALT